MREQAFEILGIKPTDDGRAIRAAFLRLARIYHPDRFVGQPDDVRVEAERRMKDATIAYDALRDLRPPERVEPQLSEAEVKERAAEYRVAIAKRHAEEEQARARWRRWDQIEQEARERAEVESRIAAMIRNDVEGHPGAAPAPRTEARPAPPAVPAPQARPMRSGSLFEERLASARRGATAPLAPREQKTG